MTSCLLTGKLLSRSRALDASTADPTLLPLAATLADRSVAVLEIGPLVTFELLNLFRGHPHPRDKQVSDYAKRSCQGRQRARQPPWSNQRTCEQQAMGVPGMCCHCATLSPPGTVSQ
jgi:hypothetical protein